jgi:hypothetical protein
MTDLDPFPIFVTDVPGSKIQFIARRDSITGRLHASSVIFNESGTPDLSALSKFIGLGVRVITGRRRTSLSRPLRSRRPRSEPDKSVEEYVASLSGSVTDVGGVR